MALNRKASQSERSGVEAIGFLDYDQASESMAQMVSQARTLQP
jgi:hypothetical protein